MARRLPRRAPSWLVAAAALLLVGLALVCRLRVEGFAQALPYLPPTWRSALQASSTDGLDFVVDHRPIASPADTQHPGLGANGEPSLFHFDALTGELVSLDLSSGERRPLRMDGDCDPRIEPAGHCVDPCWLALPDGSQRLYYLRTPDQGDPALSQGISEIHSARSSDGLSWQREPGARLTGRGMVDPDVVALPGGGFRLYYTSLGVPGTGQPGPVPGVYSALSTDGLHFEIEPGLRLADASATSTIGLPQGGFRSYYHGFEPGLRSALSTDGLHFEIEPGFRVPPEPLPGQRWLGPEAPAVLRRADGSLWMVFSASREPLFPLNLIAAWRHREPSRSSAAPD